jgi:hypothetical protein
MAAFHLIIYGRFWVITEVMFNRSLFQVASFDNRYTRRGRVRAMNPYFLKRPRG